MISAKHLLFIEPLQPARSVPLVDQLTRRITAAYRSAAQSWGFWCGVHVCSCGTHSTNRDYFLPNGDMTNSLCVHYLAYHREEVAAEQLARLAMLSYGEADPTEDELHGRRWRGNRPGDYFGRDRLAEFAKGGLDLAAAYLAAEESAENHAVFHHALSNFRHITLQVIPEFLGAARQTHGGVRQWTTQAFWPESWKEAWVPPLLILLGHTNRETRRWAASSLGNVGDKQCRWGFRKPSGRIKWVKASGIRGPQGKTLQRALLATALRDRSKAVRVTALEALNSISPLVKSSIQRLVEALQAETDDEVRRVATRVLQTNGLQVSRAWRRRSGRPVGA
jgi:hypothetical protein